ncbi:MAG: DUF1772 domain-containing protein [Acidobacteria bacterium]|nr:DUF1772 domain-containing protein [Acidobacteriota bacterium]
MILDVLSIVSIGLLIGAEFSVSAFINPVLLKLEPVAEARATSLFAQNLGQMMPFWYVANLLLLIAEVVMHRHDAGISWLTAAPMLWVVTIGFTLLILVPINNRIATMNPNAYSDKLKQEHAKWEMLHRWRVLSLTMAFVSFLIGIRV